MRDPLDSEGTIVQPPDKRLKRWSLKPQVWMTFAVITLLAAAYAFVAVIMTGHFAISNPERASQFEIAARNWGIIATICLAAAGLLIARAVILWRQRGLQKPTKLQFGP